MVAQPEVARGELESEVVRFLVGFEHVGLQQRVVRDAGQRDAVVGEDVLVVLEVLAELGVGVRFQPGLQPRQHFVAAAAGRRAGVAVWASGR
jgi:hypothetical protein